ncbi:dipeptidase [Sandaracinus amylolyticus]|uniref:dipeptidase n=1 Tax=Sandaracinus amylolyticus TaxID=927083 RepID=UPI001F3FB32B|nr:membrane dipeptidase [Sandaracinus amylolyticus]UJR80686.1 Microsomal dipeptidase [Sandaracinus amylolyticus]
MSAVVARANDRDAGDVARAAGVPREAVELAWSCEVIDLHLESFIPPRLWGYDLLARNRLGPLGGRFFGHLDVPRALEGGLTGAMWSIATNIARGASARPALLETNLRDLQRTLERSGAITAVRTPSEYRAARAQGKHAALLAVQGGNALEGAEENVASIGGGLITRVTLVHLSNSIYGDTSSPLRLRGDRGLTDAGREMVKRLNDAKVLVDLAHVSPKGFWDAVEVHDRAQPLIVTHTGASAVHPMWRNIDDDQIRAVADTGGVVAVIFHHAFLGRGVRDGRRVIDHLEAILRAGGEEAAAIGSDYDGAIIPPPDLRDGAHAYYRLVSYMLERGWKEDRIRRVLGENFLRSWSRLRA